MISRGPAAGVLGLFGRVAGICLVLVAALGCDTAQTPGAVDAVVDGLAADLALPDGGDGAGAWAALDFVVQGCQERTSSRCVGRAPLTLIFVPVGPEEGVAASWDLGDGDAPIGTYRVTHVYTKPGVYSVTLTVDHDGDTLSERKDDFVVVEEPEIAEPCAAVGSCARGVCVCDTESCQPALAEGLCLLECEVGTACPQDSDTSCVDLRASAEAAPWRRQLCLPACQTDEDCQRAGFSCRVAPAVGGGWSYVCLPPEPRDLGAPCRAANGELRSDLCVGGQCLAIGAAGYCSATCVSGDCPDGSACVDFNGGAVTAGAPVCLARCGAATTCDADPSLTCELPDPQGSLGFVLASTAGSTAAGYCAPRRCDESAMRCPTGSICDDDMGGFCLPSD